MDSLSTMHSAFYERPPHGCWVDEWSCLRTSPPTTSGNRRPVFRRIVADQTLKAFEKRYPGLIPRELYNAYLRFTANFPVVRKIWSTGKLTLGHGDSHVGNMMFFPDGKVGFFDMQCVSAEPPMRDLTYHLLSSYNKDDLAREETGIIKQYLEMFNRKLKARGISDQLSFEEAWAHYRSISWWAFAAFIISAGASELMKAEAAITSCDRVCVAMMRIDAVGALNDHLAKVGA